MKPILDPKKIGNHKTTTEQRFWSKVNILGEDDCWIWAGLVQRYGKFKVPTGIKGGTYVQAHKYSYFLKTGYYPKSSEYVCHTCDNPPCVNPNHLFLGTQFDNMRDMVAKGRNADTKGSKNPNSKINERDAVEMRRLHSNGLLGQEIAKLFGISKTQASRILRGENWSIL